MSVNDRFKTGFDHDSSNESDINGQLKDYLNSAWANNKGSINDGLFNEAGTSGTDQEDGSILTMNDRLKGYFNGSTIADGLKQWNGVSGEDTYPPVMINNLSIVDDDTTTTSIKYTFKPNEGGFFDCVLLPNDADAPSTAQIRLGQDSTGTPVSAGMKKLNRPMSSSNQYITFQNLTSGTSYDLFLTFEDDETTPNLSNIVYSQKTGETLSETPPDPPADTTPPEFVTNNGDAIWLFTSPSQNVIQVRTSINESGDIFGICVPYNATTPTANEIIAGVDYGSVTIADSVSQSGVEGNATYPLNFLGLTPSTQYDIYVIARDTAGNVMTQFAKLNDLTTADAVSFENDYSLRNMNGVVPLIENNSDNLSGSWSYSAWYKNVNNGNTCFFTYGLADVFDNGENLVGYNGSTLTSADAYNNFMFSYITNGGKFSLNTNGDSSGTEYESNVISDTISNYISTEWNHWLFTCDFSSKVFNVYVNNESLCSFTIADEYFPDNVNQDVNRQVSSGYFIGFFPYSTENMSLSLLDWQNNVKIDELCVWNGVLDSNNRTKIYNNGVPFDLSSDDGNYNQSSNIHCYNSLDESEFKHGGNPTSDEAFQLPFYKLYLSNDRSTKKMVITPENQDYIEMNSNDTPNNPIDRYNRSQSQGAKYLDPSIRQSSSYESGGTP